MHIIVTVIYKSKYCKEKKAYRVQRLQTDCGAVAQGSLAQGSRVNHYVIILCNCTYRRNTDERTTIPQSRSTRIDFGGKK